MVTGRLVTGWRVVAQALYRRLITPRGTLRGGDEEAAYGFDLADHVGAVADDELALATIPGLVKAELMKDDRVADVAVSAATTTDAAGLVYIEVTADVQLVDDGEAFALTLNVTEGGVQLALLESP